jgi:succinate dehydrogenase / fumarate reductase flavoprotein subunit
MDPNWRKQLLVCRAAGGDDAVIPDISITREVQVPMRPDLLEVFEISELEKYYTDEELADHPGRRG